MENLYDIKMVGTCEFFMRFGRGVGVRGLNRRQLEIIDLIGDKAHEALGLGMIPDHLSIWDKTGKEHSIPYMSPRDVVMQHDSNGDVWISRHFNMFDCRDISVVDLRWVERNRLRKLLTRKYQNDPLPSIRDMCYYATDRMISFQKMINKIFQSVPMFGSVSAIQLLVNEISDVKIIKKICSLYNSGIESNANLTKITTDFFEDL